MHHYEWNEEYPYAFDIYGAAITWIRIVLSEDRNEDDDAENNVASREGTTLGLGNEDELFQWRIDVRNFGQSKSRITELEKEVDLLKSQKVLDEDVVGQLNQLKQVLDLAGRGEYKVVAARVINRGSTATFKQTITIDAGSSDGISKNMTVISEAGLVGVVKSVTSNSSIVLLMSDPTFKIGVRIAGTQSIGVVSGQGGNKYLLQLLDATGEIKVGDNLVARGSQNGSPFVPGVPVGTVSSVQSNASSITQNADVEGASNLERIGVVAVVVSNPKQDPRDALVPKPSPTVTVYVTPSPSPSASK